MSQTEGLPKAWKVPINSVKLRVLVADDNHETRRAVHMMLSSNPGVTVVAIASDGQEAVDLALKYRPDLVVMDINMPKKDGLAAFKEMSQSQPDIGGIIISSELPSGLTRDDDLPGVQEFLLKPFDFDEFDDAIQRVAASVLISRARQSGAPPSEPVHEPAGHIENLKKLALEYAKNRRTDDLAMGVLEELARNPACEARWLQMLAITYIVRQDWAKLKTLASRLEQQAAGDRK